MSQVHREDCARLVHPMLSVADMVGRAGSFMIMMRVGMMETSLSLVPLTCGDLVSFHCVFSKYAIYVILLEA